MSYYKVTRWRCDWCIEVVHSDDRPDGWLTLNEVAPWPDGPHNTVIDGDEDICTACKELLVKLRRSRAPRG